MDPIADASLPDMRARSSPGTAIAAMMPMIATTISSSISVKPLLLWIFFILSPQCECSVKPGRRFAAEAPAANDVGSTLGNGYAASCVRLERCVNCYNEVG